VPLARRPQFRGGRDQPLDDRGQDGLDVAVGKGFLGGEQLLRRDRRLVAQQAAEGFDFCLRQMGEVGEGALADFRALAPAFAEQDGGRGVAVGR
jgi:hypothetical protein